MNKLVIPSGPWEFARPMTKSYLLASTQPLVGTLTPAGKLTILKKDSMDWLGEPHGKIYQLAPRVGDIFTRMDVAQLIYPTLSARIQGNYPNWQSDNKDLVAVLNYGHRFVYFATYMGLLEQIKPHTWRRTDKRLEDIKHSPWAAKPGDVLSPFGAGNDEAVPAEKEAALNALFDEFEAHVLDQLAELKIKIRSLIKDDE